MAVHLTRAFAAPPEAVWTAWTGRLGDWFGAPGSEVEATQDAIPGGAWDLRMLAPDGNRYGFSGRYLEVEAPSRLVFTLAADGEPGEETCSVLLAPHGAGTEQEFRQEGGGLTAEQYEQATAGWALFFERLDALTRG